MGCVRFASRLISNFHLHKVFLSFESFNERRSMSIFLSSNDCLVDEQIKITCHGLPPSSIVKVCNNTIDDNVKFSSEACYYTNDQGCLDLSSMPSIQGSYLGIESMGIFWAMTPSPGQRRGTRLMKKNVQTPLVSKLSVMASDKILCTTEVRRWYKANSVTRIPVRDKGIVGTLFLPAGDGPFPGVIDMFGGAANLFEYKAALLASRGFAAMAIAYFGVEHLPSFMDSLDLRYFMNVVELLNSHPRVTPGGVAIHAVCKGVELALLTATVCPLVKAVVCNNGRHFLGDYPVNLDGELFFDSAYSLYTQEGLPKQYLTPEGYTFGKEIYPSSTIDSVAATSTCIPVEKANDCRFLLIQGGDDPAANLQSTDHIASRLDAAGYSDRYEQIFYPLAGHLIEPPYSPLCRSFYIKWLEECGLAGGHPKEHALAQEDCWQRTLTFLRNSLASSALNYERRSKSLPSSRL